MYPEYVLRAAWSLVMDAIRKPVRAEFVETVDDRGRNVVGVVEGANSDGTLQVRDAAGDLHLCPYSVQTTRRLHDLTECDSFTATALNSLQLRLRVHN